MAYTSLPLDTLRRYGEALFVACGFSPPHSGQIMDVLLRADLYGMESHGVQRLIRYYQAIRQGAIVPDAPMQLLHQSSISQVYDAPRSMGQLVALRCMEQAIDMARQHGIGMVAARGSNHFGIAGYYSLMAAQQDMLGIAMTNTEAIAIPTHGSRAMLGTSPIALCMPADPVPFWYDAATTVVTRGKLEVYNKRGAALPAGWAADAQGLPSQDAAQVLDNIIRKLGGGIYPLGGVDEAGGSHKGYGLGVMVELFTAIFAGGTTAPHVRHSGNGDTSFSLCAIDYGIFGNKAQIRARMSQLLQELRDSPKAAGQTRIYTHGEKEFESEERLRTAGIPVNDKTLQELVQMGHEMGLNPQAMGIQP